MSRSLLPTLHRRIKWNSTIVKWCSIQWRDFVRVGRCVMKRRNFPAVRNLSAPLDTAWALLLRRPQLLHLVATAVLVRKHIR